MYSMFFLLEFSVGYATRYCLCHLISARLTPSEVLTAVKFWQNLTFFDREVAAERNDSTQDCRKKAPCD
jgi:hypothetical protein